MGFAAAAFSRREASRTSSFSIFALPLAFALALACDREIRLKGFYRVVFFIPPVLSEIVVGFIWRWILDSGVQANQHIGLLNYFLDIDLHRIFSNVFVLIGFSLVLTFALSCALALFSKVHSGRYRFLAFYQEITSACVVLAATRPIADTIFFNIGSV